MDICITFFLSGENYFKVACWALKQHPGQRWVNGFQAPPPAPPQSPFENSLFPSKWVFIANTARETVTPPPGGLALTARSVVYSLYK